MKKQVIFLLILVSFFCLAVQYTFGQKVDLTSRLEARRIWFIPGWQHDKVPVEKYKKKLREVFDEEAFIHSWKASGTWDETQKEVLKESKRLAGKITNLPEEQRQKMVLIGHSLGARMIMEASQVLIEKKIKVKRVILLGAAIAFDDKHLENIEKISIEPPINIFNREDGVLKILFSERENTFASGHVGICVPTAFQQYEVPSTNKNKKDFKTEITDNHNHFVKSYIETMKKVLNREIMECFPPELGKIDAILSTIGLKNNAKTAMPALIPATIVEKHNNWELSSSIWGYIYTIFDPFGRLIFSGSRSEAEEIWKKIKQQLD